MRSQVPGVKAVLTIAAVLAVLVGWAVLAGAPAATSSSSPPPGAPVVQSSPSHGSASPGLGDAGLAPLPTLVGIDTRPLPAPRPDVRTRASYRR